MAGRETEDGRQVFGPLQFPVYEQGDVRQYVMIKFENRGFNLVVEINGSLFKQKKFIMVKVSGIFEQILSHQD